MLGNKYSVRNHKTDRHDYSFVDGWCISPNNQKVYIIVFNIGICVKTKVQILDTTSPETDLERGRWALR